MLLAVPAAGGAASSALRLAAACGQRAPWAHVPPVLRCRPLLLLAGAWPATGGRASLYAYEL
eukprot:494507-Lingulodinium_polyedra.AAC.1